MATIWITGIPASGKTTLGDALAELLREQGIPVLRIDGDHIRSGLCSDLDLSDKGRAENIRRAGEIALLANVSHIHAVVSLVSPFRSDRDAVRARHTLANVPFIETFMDASLDICAARDPKKLYAKAYAGLIKNLTGFDAPYEAPEKPEMTIPHTLSPAEAAEQIFALLKS